MLNHTIKKTQEELMIFTGIDKKHGHGGSYIKPQCSECGSKDVSMKFEDGRLTARRCDECKFFEELYKA